MAEGSPVNILENLLLNVYRILLTKVVVVWSAVLKIPGDFYFVSRDIINTVVTVVNYCGTVTLLLLLYLGVSRSKNAENKRLVIDRAPTMMAINVTYEY